MKKILVFLGAFVSAFVALFSLPVFADEDSTVSVEIEPQLIAIELWSGSPSEIYYGIVGASDTDLVPVRSDNQQSNPQIVFTNVGNVDERFQIRGTDAINGSGTTWTLSAGDSGADAFVHKYSTDSGVLTGIAKLSTSNENLETVSPGSSSTPIYFRLDAPTSISDPSSSYATEVTVVAVKN